MLDPGESWEMQLQVEGFEELVCILRKKVFLLGGKVSKHLYQGNGIILPF